MKTIEIVISPAGETKVETRGFAGGACQQASRFIESALGNVLSQTLTAEFHQHREQQQNHSHEEN